VDDYLDKLMARGIISDRAVQRMMTHQAEEPNPARPYLDFARNFAGGGLQRALDLPNNFMGRAIQNPDNIAALGMVGKIGSQGLLLESNKLTNQIQDLLALRGARTVKQNAQLEKLRARANEIDAQLERGTGPVAMPGAMTREVRQQIHNIPWEIETIPLKKID